MIIHIKKVLSIFMLSILLFTNSLYGVSFAKKDKESNSKKEFDLKTKYSSKKLNRAKNTLSKKDRYEIIINSSKTYDEVNDYYTNLDKNIKVKNLGKNTFKLKVPKNSILSESFSGIENGVIPENIGNDNVIEPEIFESFGDISDNSGSSNTSPLTPLLLGEGNSGSLWNLDKVGASGFQADLQSKNKIKIAILDTGIDSNHTDLSSNINKELSYDFINDNSGSLDDNGHGTQVAGIVGASLNGTGIYGVNSNSDLVSLKVLDQDGLGSSYEVIEAINYAVSNGIKVVNISFGGSGDPTTSAVCNAISDAKKVGTFVVVSAGNTSQDIKNIVPAGCSDAIVVGSNGKTGEKSSFSNYGSGVIFAPGEDIYTTNLNNSYITKNGTSFASPLVAGIISKELAFNSALTFDEVLNNMKGNYGLNNTSSLTPSLSNTSPLTPLLSVEGNSGSLTNTSSGLTFSGITNTGTQIDYSKMKYYSGYFIHEGKTYGNSLYDDNFSFTAEELKGVQVYTYEEYQNILKNAKKEFSAMSIPTNGLIGKWDLNGNANDSSSNGNNGTPYNVTWVDSGRGDGKLVASFNGVNSYISAGNLGINGGPITISLWVSINSLNSRQDFISQRNNQTITGYNIYYLSSNNKLIFLRNRPNVISDEAMYSTGLTLGKYYNFILTYDTNNNITGYINGSWIGTSVYGYGNGLYSPSNGLNIGRDIEGLNSYFNGKIGNVAIYNRALSSAEIQQLYQDGLNITNNQTSSNIPTYTYNPVIATPTLKYSQADTSALNYLSNKVQTSSHVTTSKANTANAGDPVNLATGEFDYENTLMSIPGKKLPFEFKLNYKNQTYYNGPAGINWDHNYNKYLTEETNGNILYYNGKLGVLRFIKNTDGTFQYNPGMKANLVLSGGLYQINYDSGDKEYFNTDKKLSKLEDKYSNNLQFSYSGGLLSQATDTLGRKINYNYFDHNRLANVVDFNGKKVELTYFTGDTNSGSIYDLKEIKINNGTGATKTIGFEYSTGSDDIIKHNITKLIDSKGQTYVTNTYSNDRVATQTYGNGTITYNYTTNASNQVTKNTVTNKLGDITDYFYDANGNNTQTVYHTSNGNVTYNYTYNSLGYLETQTDPKGNGTKYSYDTKGNLIEKRQKADMSLADDNANDIISSYTYNDKNQVLTQELPQGTTDTINRISTTNVYDTNGNLTQTTTQNLKTSSGANYSVTKSFGYNTNGELTSSTDPKGNITNFIYSGGLLVQTISGTGINTRTTSFTYNNYGILTSTTDPRGNTTTYQINEFNQTATGITSEGIVSSFVYDLNNNVIDKSILKDTINRISTINTYNVLDELTQSVSNYDSGKTITTNITYDNNGNVTEKQTGSGAKIKYSYNEFAKIKEERIIVNPADSTKDIVTSYTYDDNGNIISKTDPKGNIINYTYDLYDRVIKETKPDGSYTMYNYYKDGSISQLQNYSSGSVKLTRKVFIYNGVGKVLKEINYKDVLNNTGIIITTQDYDLNGNIISKIDAKGNTTNYTYDEFNNLIQTIDSKGNKVVNSYDKNNNLKTSSQPSPLGGEGVITTYTYDKDNRLKTETNNLNKTKTYSYNNLNQITSITDEKGNIINYTYDYNGKVKTKNQITSNGTITTSYTYDERLNQTSIIDQNGNITTYVYNNLNQLTKTIYPDNKEINYSYDKAGNLLNQTDPNGSITTNTYDNLNRLISRSIQTGTGVLGITSENYSYDELGRLIQANDSNNHKLNFSYDSLNRLVSESSPQPSPSGEGAGTGIVTVSYGYDDNNNLLTITNPNGKTTSYSYDELNRVTNVSFSGNTIANYSYSGILNDQINLGNGKNILNTFDGLNRLNSITVTNPSLTLPLGLMEGKLNYTYTYDEVSNITSDSYKNYTYDNIYRLTQVTNTQSGTLLESFNYDNAGNRITDKNNTNYTTNNLNQYTTLSGTILSGSLVYDNNGNLKQNSKYSFTYDYKNRLIKVTNITGTGIIAEFSYDILGRRYEKKTQTETISYVYSDKNIISEYKTTNGVTYKKDYVNGLGIDNTIAVIQDDVNLTGSEKEELTFCKNTVLTQTGNFLKYGYTNIVDRCNTLQGSGSEIITNTYYFHKNHLGSVVGITDNSGSLVSSYEYDSYGNFSLSGSDIGNNILFTGREYDKEIGLYYYRARYYDSELGRFVSRDPIGQVDDVNLYGYVGNNPINAIDPSGEVKQFLAGFTQGDYNENGNGWSTAGQITAGFIPYYGQAADVRDITYAWNNGTYGDIAMAGIGFIPGVGDGAKAIKKSGVINNARNYAINFWKEYGEKIENYQVHHSLPQKYEKMFEEIGINIHDNKYLRGVETKVHAMITNEWNKFDPKGNINVTIKEIKKFADEIDNKYYNKFIFIKK